MPDAIFVGLLSFVAVGAVFAGAILGIVAMVRITSLRKEVARIREGLEALQRGGAYMPPGWREPARPAAPVAPPVAPPLAELPSAGLEAAVELAARSTPPPPLPTPDRTPAPPPPPAATPWPAPATASNAVGQLESKIGRQWIAWAGAIVVFFSAAFFLKHAFDNDWIGPTGQVIISALASVGILAVGARFVGKGWGVLGQCLIGLGLGILYATCFAGFSAYDVPVFSRTTAFALMVGVTVAGMVLAVLYNAAAIAFLALLGGLLTPVMLSTGQDARDVLMSYLLLLDLGVLAVAFFRGWRSLDTLAMAGTFIMYSGWYGKFYRPEALGPALAWLGAFYLVFLILPFLYHLVRRQNFTVERFMMALTNAAFTGGMAWTILRQDYLFTMGFVALGMAGTYLALGAAIRRRLPDDATALFGAIALTVTFLTLAVPMQLRAHGVMLAWVAEAPVLTYLAYRFRYRPVRGFAAGVLALGLARLFLSESHWPLHAGLFVPFFNTQWISAMAVPVAGALLALIHHRHPDQASPMDRAIKIIAALGAGLVALVVTTAELSGWLDNEVSHLAAYAASATLWAAGAWAYLGAGLRAPRAAKWVWAVGVFVLGGAAVFALTCFGQTLAPGHLPLLNARFGACLAVIVTGLAYAQVLIRRSDPNARIVAGTLLVAAVTGLLALLSVEAAGFCHDSITDPVVAGRAARMAVTVVWGLYAIAMLVLGFARRLRAFRLGGLGLFGLSALKLVLFDLAHLQDVYRIVSFLVLGLLMLGASYLYHILERRLARPASGAEPLASGEAK